MQKGTSEAVDTGRVETLEVEVRKLRRAVEILEEEAETLLNRVKSLEKAVD